MAEKIRLVQETLEPGTSVCRGDRDRDRRLVDIQAHEHNIVHQARPMPEALRRPDPAQPSIRAYAKTAVSPQT